MNFNDLLVDYNGSAAVVTINRPAKLNALNAETFNELKSAFRQLQDDDTVGVIILTGAGEKAFAAGADISELTKQDIIGGKIFSESGQAVFNLIEKLEKPVIAAVNGFALGGGCELAMACHFRIASENAKFGQPEVNLGIIPGYGGTQRLPRLVGKGLALEYILTGDMIDAQEAFRIGLVNKIYPQQELLAKVMELGVKISGKARQAVKHALNAVNACWEISEQEGQNLEASLFGLCCGTEDFKEGTGAFLEKRKPVFKNK